MNGAFAGQMQARVEWRHDMRLALVAKHHRCRATRLAVHGDAHLLVIASVTRGAIDKVDRHHNQAVLVLAGLARPSADALFIEAQKRLGIVAGNVERQLINDHLVLGGRVDGDNAEVAFLHGRVKRPHLGKVPRLQNAHKANVQVVCPGIRPVEHLVVHQGLLAQAPAREGRHHAKVRERHGKIEEHHVVLDRVFHIVAGKGVRVLAHQLKRIGTRLLRRYLAGNTLLGHVLRTNAHGQALAKCPRPEQVGDADLIAAGRALKHALGRLALKGRATEGAGNTHVRGLLELLGRAAVFPQNRLVAPVRIEKIPVGVHRRLELRHMGELKQSIDNRQRRMANAKGALGLPRIGLPRNERAAVGALKAALSLV